MFSSLPSYEALVRSGHGCHPVCQHKLSSIAPKAHIAALSLFQLHTLCGSP